jgi:hypothetical protein
MVVSESRPTIVTESLGQISVERNSVFRQFKYLFDRFSIISKGTGSITNILFAEALNTRGQLLDSGRDTINLLNLSNADRVRIAVFPGWSYYDAEYSKIYPAIEDIQQLDHRIIPDNMSVFYVKSDKDDKDAGAVIFWRYGTLQDVIKYSTNITAWNLAARVNNGLGPPFPSDPEDEYFSKEGYHKYLGLLLALTGGQELPKGYLILSGEFVTEQCGEPTWIFHMDSPEIELEAMLVRNPTNRAVRLDALIGNEFGEARLRRAEAPLPPSLPGASSIGVGSVIPPGHSVLVPTRILLESRYFPPTNEASIKGAEVYKRLVSRGISARPDVYGRPVAPDFAFGPQLNVSGIIVDGRAIKLSPQSTNLMDVSFSPGLGSCPYLLSWDGQRMQWAEYGKVLHPADEQAHEGVQSVVLPGFVSRFRLEEREPELTTLDRAELVLSLRDGEQVTAQPIGTDGRSMFPSHLFWDEAQEFAFALPRGVSPDDVTQSRLVLTGYYQRYSSFTNFSRGDGAAYLRAAFPSEPKPSH